MWAAEEPDVQAPSPVTEPPGRILVADDNAEMPEYVVHLLGPRDDVAAVAASDHALAAERCASIVQHFLMLARQPPPERTQVQLNTIVREAVGLLEYAFRVDDIAAQLHLTPDLRELRADAHQPGKWW